MYVSDPVTFGFDIPQTLRRLADGITDPPTPGDLTVIFEAGVGFYKHCDNHETAVHYVATPRPLPKDNRPAGEVAAAVTTSDPDRKPWLST